MTSNRRHTRELERYFTIVDWDQRGAGKSYRAIQDLDRMTISQFAEGTREITADLTLASCERAPTRRTS